MAKCFVRNFDGGAPFSFYERVELIRDGIQLSTDGHLTNLIMEDTLTLREGTSVPWRGAREKSSNLLEALIDMCTREDDIVFDLTASTGKYWRCFVWNCISLFSSTEILTYFKCLNRGIHQGLQSLKAPHLSFGV